MTYHLLMHQARCAAMDAANASRMASSWLGASLMSLDFTKGPSRAQQAVNHVATYAASAGTHYRRAHELYDRAERIRRRLRENTLAAAEEAVQKALAHEARLLDDYWGEGYEVATHRAWQESIRKREICEQALRRLRR